jgi:hypothetical protein
MFASAHLHTMAVRLRAGLVVALAYLLVLQGLLAPGASLAAHHAADPAAMILCDGDMPAGGPHEAGLPAGQSDPHDLCCAAGCLPSLSSLAAAALPASGVQPAWSPPATGQVVLVRAVDPTGPPRAWRPGSSGPRAPPSPIA